MLPKSGWCIHKARQGGCFGNMGGQRGHYQSVAGICWEASATLSPMDFLLGPIKATDAQKDIVSLIFG